MADAELERASAAAAAAGRQAEQAEAAERERGRMHAELQSELGCGGKHTSLLATAVTTGTMCEDDVR